ncbi:MAG TPA: hypothetical protein PKG50_02595 [Candidatus Bipolaricaulis anaerobius]|nr:hypothetical protein [Candidatus Bipolaricaulis anaerobius]HNS23614.1 hypothetical protein [Candidatus Bipolaricaulis anaerobius]
MKRMVVLGLVLLVGGSVWAAQPEDAILPEFLVGTLGGYAGAVIGAQTLAWVFAAGATGWDALARTIFGAFLGFAGGTIVGSGVGVIVAGSALGVEGDVGLCFLGAAGGTGAAFGIGFAFDISETAIPFAPPLAAALATAGFNVGALAGGTPTMGGDVGAR